MREGKGRRQEEREEEGVKECTRRENTSHCVWRRQE